MAGNKTKSGAKKGSTTRAVKAKPAKPKAKSQAARPAKKPAPPSKGKGAEKKPAKQESASRKPKVFLPGPKLNPVAKRALAKRGLLEKQAKKAAAAEKPTRGEPKGQRKSRLPQMPPPRLVMPAKPAAGKAKPSDPKAATKSAGPGPSKGKTPPPPAPSKGRAAPAEARGAVRASTEGRPIASKPSKASSTAPPPPAKPGKPAIPPPPPAKSGKGPAPSAARGPASRGGDALRIAPRQPPPSVGPRSTGPLKNAGKSLVLAPARSSSAGAMAPARGPERGSSRPAPGRGVTLVRRTSDRPTGNTAPLLPTPLRNTTVRVSLEDRAASIEKRLERESDEFRTRYYDQFDMSWIYHDSALEGVVYTMEELRAGLAKTDAATAVVESGLQPAADEIRRHKEAIEFVRDYATKKRLPPTVDTVKKIYLILHPSEGDLKTVKYRRDIPQHRLYFHEYAQPDKIAYKVRQIVDWVNDPEIRKSRGALRIAARAHYDMLRVFPFQSDSGKVARLFMNMLLMRVGLPPSIIHSTERQRYYDALKGSALVVLSMVQESVENAMLSVEKLLDEHGTKTRS